ncbi:hypothetical protein ACLOJK_034470, partial [Asimina triloba]
GDKAGRHGDERWLSSLVKIESCRHPHAFDRIRSSDLTVAGGGSPGSLMEKMEHQMVYVETGFLVNVQ